MRHLYTMPLAAIALAASAAVPPQAPQMQAPVPASFSGFHPEFAAPLPNTLGSAPRLSAPSLAPGQSSPMYGFLTGTNIEGLKTGLYSLDLTDGGSTFLWQDFLTGWGWTNYTGWYRDGSLWTLAGVKLQGQFMGYALVEYDLSNGDLLTTDYIDLQEEGMQSVFVSSAYRLMDDYVYGYSYDEEGENMVFAMAPATDFHNVRILRKVDFDNVCASMTYDSLTDTMYGVTTSGQFVSIAPDGTQTSLYSVLRNIPNVDPRVAAGMAWDPSRGACIWDAYCATSASASTALYALAPDAKSPVLIDESRGAELYSVLFDTSVNARPDAPAAATFKSYDFVTVATDGSITWTLPSKSVAGAPLSGTLDYALYVDGVEKATGKGAPGSEAKVAVSGLKNANHVFSLVCTSADGLRGESAVYRRWVGADTPLAPGNVRLTETLVSWDVPAGSVHDGYVDYSDINYTVYLNGRKIGDTKSTSLSYTLPEGEPFTSYTAEVTATFKGWSSENGVSNFIQYGDPLQMPVHFRPLEKELEMMTLINVDGHVYEDGTEDTWRFTTEMGFPSFASGFNGDDWLILPPMVFDNTEKAYRFEMEIGLVHDSDTTGTYEVCIGTAPTAEAMTRVIIPASRCYHMLGDILEEFFAVPAPGVYYIGIHTKTNKVSFHVSDIDLSLSDRSAAVPVGVTDLTAVPGENGALNATVSFTLPTSTAAGTALDPDKDLTAVVSSYATEPGYDKERELVESKTLTGKPGSKQEIQISTAQNYNAIVVAITSDGLTGKGAETMIYTGVLRPYIVNDLKASVSEDNMTITLTWTRPTEADDENADAPIGDSFLYLIYDYISSNWEYLDEAGWDVYEYSFTVPDNYPLSYLRLGVMAYNAAGLSYHVAGLAESVGHPVEVPWTNDLDNDVTLNNSVVLTPTEQYSDVYWIPGGDPASLISPIFSLPSGLAFIGYTVDATDRKSRLALPKVTTAGLNDVCLSFDYWGGRYAAPMRLMAQAYGMDEPVVIAELPADPDGWTTYSFKLPESLQDQGWVALYVDADFPDDQHFAMFSGYSFTSVSGVDGIAAFAPAIVGGKGILSVTGMGGEALAVTDMQGRNVLLREALGDSDVFFLPAGLYIVRAGSQTVKVIVR